MKVLGIETATSVCAAAVVSDSRVTAERSIDSRNVHAEKLLSLIDAALGDAALTCHELDSVAVSIGPGSFTGLRIGLSVAKGLAYATSKPLVAVPTLEALAMNLVDTASAGPFILTALDARRDEVYCQLFRLENRELAPEWDARDMTVSELFEELDGKSVVVVGDGSKKVLSHAGSGDRIASVTEELSRCSARTVALLGHALLAEGKTVDPAQLEPRYIKEFFLQTHSEG